MYYTKDLVPLLARALDLPVSRVRNQVLPTTLAAIRMLAEDEGLTLTNFGTFKRWDRPARTGRNPKTGSRVPVPPTSTLRFRPSHQLLRVLDGVEHPNHSLRDNPAHALKVLAEAAGFRVNQAKIDEMAEYLGASGEDE